MTYCDLFFIFAEHPQRKTLSTSVHRMTNSQENLYANDFIIQYLNINIFLFAIYIIKY